MIDDLIKRLRTNHFNWQTLPACFETADELEKIKSLVDEQANDEGLWFAAETAAEAYLQSALRRLHEAIEGKTADEIAKNIVSAGHATDE